MHRTRSAGPRVALRGLPAGWQELVTPGRQEEQLQLQQQEPDCALQSAKLAGCGGDEASSAVTGGPQQATLRTSRVASAPAWRSPANGHSRRAWAQQPLPAYAQPRAFVLSPAPSAFVFASGGRSARRYELYSPAPSAADKGTLASHAYAFPAASPAAAVAAAAASSAEVTPSSEGSAADVLGADAVAFSTPAAAGGNGGRQPVPSPMRAIAFSAQSPAAQPGPPSGTHGGDQHQPARKQPARTHEQQHTRAAAARDGRACRICNAPTAIGVGQPLTKTALPAASPGTQQGERMRPKPSAQRSCATTAVALTPRTAAVRLAATEVKAEAGTGGGGASAAGARTARRVGAAIHQRDAKPRNGRSSDSRRIAAPQPPHAADNCGAGGSDSYDWLVQKQFELTAMIRAPVNSREVLLSSPAYGAVLCTAAARPTLGRISSACHRVPACGCSALGYAPELQDVRECLTRARRPRTLPPPCRRCASSHGASSSSAPSSRSWPTARAGRASSALTSCRTCCCGCRAATSCRSTRRLARTPSPCIRWARSGRTARSDWGGTAHQSRSFAKRSNRH